MSGGGERRVLVISHPAVTSVNQEVYRELARRGWDVEIVLPSQWRHTYSQGPIAPRALAGLERSLHPVRVAFPGHPQRHFYLTSCRSLCTRSRPDVAFVEAESYSLVATQWGRVCKRLGVPFGIQCYENIDRALPHPVRLLRSRVLRDAAFVAARSETAASLTRQWGARGEVAIAPPAVPIWENTDISALRDSHRPFTVGYAGRLVQSKGLFDLLAAVRELPEPVQLLLIGNGELRAQLEGQPIPGSEVRVLDGLAHSQMASAYAQIDVLVLPSHSTATWKEQFGRVIVEALWCGVPVIGSDSGEIPWLINLTGGGLIFPEGDLKTLITHLRSLRDTPELRRQLAEKGQATVKRLFSVPAATDPLEGLLMRATGLPRD